MHTPLHIIQTMHADIDTAVTRDRMLQMSNPDAARNLRGFGVALAVLAVVGLIAGALAA